MRPRMAHAAPSRHRKHSSGRQLLDFGEPIYKAGARILLTDVKAKITKRVYIPLELCLEKLSDDTIIYGGENSVVPRAGRALCIIAQEPKSRSKAKVILRAADLDAFKNKLDTRTSEEGLEKMQQWLKSATGSGMPTSSILTSLLGQLLYCTKGRNNFEVSCDAMRLTKLKQAVHQRENRHQAISTDVPREIKLVPEAHPTYRSFNEIDEAEEEKAETGFRNQQQMKLDNQRVRSASISGSSATQLELAEATMKSISNELASQENARFEQEVMSKASTTNAIYKLNELRSEREKRNQDNRAYREKMQEALAANDLVRKLEAKTRRDKVRHIREMNRMKWSCFPFANSGRWQKGTVIGPGPLPIRKLALLRRPSSSSSSSASPETDSNFPGREEAKCGRTKRERLGAAFELLRGLAKTYDTHYLDFDRAFHRLDKGSRGFVSPNDLQLMLRPFDLTTDDFELLWSHLDRDDSGFITKDDLVWGFYNKRQLLREAEQEDDTVLFRADILDRITHPVEDAHGADSANLVTRSTNGEPPAAAVTRVQIRISDVCYLENVPVGFEVFCIASCCQICREEGEDTLVISSEDRSDPALTYIGSPAKPPSRHYSRLTASPLTSASWGPDPSQSIILSNVVTNQVEMQHLLLEFRATAPGATSDVQSLFLGELFFPLAQLDLGTANGPRWLHLQHGDHGGQVQLQVRVGKHPKILAANVNQNSDPVSEPKHPPLSTNFEKHDFESEKAAAQGILLSLLDGAVNSAFDRKSSTFTKGNPSQFSSGELTDGRFGEERRAARQQLESLLGLTFAQK